MFRLTFAAAAVLAAIGTALGVTGVHESSGQSLGTGLVLLLGAGVFAILALAARPNAVRIDDSPPNEEHPDTF